MSAPPVPTPDAMAAQIAQELVGEWLMDFELPMYSTCTSSRMDMALRSLREAIAHALDQARAEERAQLYKKLVTDAGTAPTWVEVEAALREADR